MVIIFCKLNKEQAGKKYAFYFDDVCDCVRCVSVRKLSQNYAYVRSPPGRIQGVLLTCNVQAIRNYMK